jgi:hypothetical protein
MKSLTIAVLVVVLSSAAHAFVRSGRTAGW